MRTGARNRITQMRFRNFPVLNNVDDQAIPLHGGMDGAVGSLRQRNQVSGSKDGATEGGTLRRVNTCDMGRSKMHGDLARIGGDHGTETKLRLGVTDPSLSGYKRFHVGMRYFSKRQRQPVQALKRPTKRANTIEQRPVPGLTKPPPA